MIPKAFILTKRLFEEFKKDFESASPTAQAVDEYLKNSKTGNFWHYDLGKSFEEEYHYHDGKGNYFHGCRFQFYKASYENRKSYFISKHIDAIEIDFIIDELNNTSKDVFVNCPDHLKISIKHSLSRQKDFLLNLASSKEYKVEGFKNRWGELDYTYSKDWSTSGHNELIDLSESSLIQKVRYLELLGIVDHLKSSSDHGYSINSIATIISSFTGEKAQSLQPILNALNNSDDQNRNNPYNSQNKIQEIRTRLVGMGFKSK